MDQFEVLGSLALKLHTEFRNLYYVFLPILFMLSLVFAWLRNPTGGPEFIETVKRTFISALLLAGFQEISDTILFLTSGLADKISDMQGLNSFMQMAGEKANSYPHSPMTLILAFDDMIIALLSLLSYVVLYIARYLMVAVYHFSWIFLSIMAPILLLFHIFSPKITLNLFKSMIEIASWKVVWAVLSAMLAALPFGQAYAADGNYLTVIVLNFVIAISMLCTPIVVKSLIGSGFTSFAESLGPITAAAMVSIPAKGATALRATRTVLGDVKSYGGHIQSAQRTRMFQKSLQRDARSINKNTNDKGSV
jgi:hypothetical protein